MKKLICFLFAVICVTAHADWVDDLESPVTTDAKWILIGGTGLTLFSLATRNSIAKPFEDSTLQHRPLGKWDKLGDYGGQLVPNALYAGGVLIAYAAGNKFGFYRAKLMIEATAYAAAITTVLKYTVREGRPYNSSVRNSFPSGHSTTAFAFAGVIAAEHGWWWGAPAMAFATFVGYSRIDDDQHRTHDVLAGATIGLTCAYGIWWAQKAEREKLGDVATVMPMPLPGGAGVNLGWAF